MTSYIRRAAAGLSALLLSLGIAVSVDLPRRSGAQTVSVTMIDNAFDPLSVTVPADTTLTWVNQGLAVHTVTSDTGDRDSGLVLPGGTFSLRFTQTGTVAYRCLLHPEMKGTVVVEAVATDPTADLVPTGEAPVEE